MRLRMPPQMHIRLNDCAADWVNLRHFFQTTRVKRKASMQANNKLNSIAARGRWSATRHPAQTLHRCPQKPNSKQKANNNVRSIAATDQIVKTKKMVLQPVSETAHRISEGSEMPQCWTALPALLFKTAPSMFAFAASTKR